MKNWFLVLVFSFSIRTFGFETSVMTFNVENLFDTEHDQGKEDETYLPKQLKKGFEHYSKCKKIKAKFHRKECFELDWNEKVLKAKLKNVASTILSVEDGRGPDNLFLVEVENIKVLERLNSEFLQKANYKTLVLIEGNDPRGIDMAFLSRYPLSSKPLLHEIDYQFKKEKDQDKKGKMRGILESEVEFPNKQKIRFLGVHLPSQGNPSYLRQQAMQHLSQMIEKQKNKSTVIGGDFNITHKEEKRKKYLKEFLSPLGLVSHLDACNKCLGTHYYHGDWSFLDILFFSQSLTANGWQLERDSVQVVNQNPLHSQQGIPIRFDEEKLSGVSDHFPVYAKIKWTKK